MSETRDPIEVAHPKRGLSLDVWAVTLAIAAALLIRFNIIHTVKW